jgi:quinolinate synthase
MEKQPFIVTQIESETERLHDKLRHVGFNKGYCRLFAPLTLEIGRLKREKNAVILAHSYQTPDIIYGIADFAGDSYQLSKKAQETTAETIVFCGVQFMAETAKILNPNKKVLLPAINAGCSLADSITAKDVRTLKKQNPGVPVVTYINTSAEVKAETDVCCTSSNAVKIIEALPGKKVIFLPDELMAKNLRNSTKKEIISWKGRCIVHEDFKAWKLKNFRDKYSGLKVLAHTECDPSVVAASDYAGGTNDMINYVKNTPAANYMLITECGMTERMKVEFPEKEFIGMCGLCPYMKQTTLALVLQALKNPVKGQIIEIPEKTRSRAEKSIQKMFELTGK